MSREQLDVLFKQYEASFDKLDISSLSNYCADTFISAGPRGTISQSKKEFETKGEEAVKFYHSVGRNSARIISKRIMPISDCYSMVVIRWGVTFEKTGSKLIEFDVTYIIQQTGVEPKIIVLISHEDEEMAMRKLGIMPR
jgi:hypothetical protein